MTMDNVLDTVKTTTKMGTDRPHVFREAVQACRKAGTLSMPGVYGGMADEVFLKGDLPALQAAAVADPALRARMLAVSQSALTAGSYAFGADAATALVGLARECVWPGYPRGALEIEAQAAEARGSVPQADVIPYASAANSRTARSGCIGIQQ